MCDMLLTLQNITAGTYRAFADRFTESPDNRINKQICVSGIYFALPQLLYSSCGPSKNITTGFYCNPSI